MSDGKENALLGPWAQRFYGLTDHIDKHCQLLSDEDLASLKVAADWPTTTNCWYMVYAVAPMVRDAVGHEQRRRARERAADDV